MSDVLDRYYRNRNLESEAAFTAEPKMSIAPVPAVAPPVSDPGVHYEADPLDAGVPEAPPVAPSVVEPQPNKTWTSHDVRLANRQVADRHGVAVGIMDALAENESGSNPHVKNRKYPNTVFGAYQIKIDRHPITREQAENPHYAADYTAKYLRKLETKYNNNDKFALAAYNWGTGNVDVVTKSFAAGPEGKMQAFEAAYQSVFGNKKGERYKNLKAAVSRSKNAWEAVPSKTRAYAGRILQSGLGRDLTHYGDHPSQPVVKTQPTPGARSAVPEGYRGLGVADVDEKLAGIDQTIAGYQNILDNPNQPDYMKADAQQRIQELEAKKQQVSSYRAAQFGPVQPDGMAQTDSEEETQMKTLELGESSSQELGESSSQSTFKPAGASSAPSVQSEEPTAIDASIDQRLAEVDAEFASQMQGREEAVARAQEAYAQAAAELKDYKINPDAFWANRSTLGKIGSVLAAALGGFAQGFSDGRVPNTALQLINQAIDRDLQAQFAAMKTKGSAVDAANNLLSRQYQQLGDLRAAKFNAKKLMLEGIKVDVSNRIAAQRASQAQQAAMREQYNKDREHSRKVTEMGMKANQQKRKESKPPAKIEQTLDQQAGAIGKMKEIKKRVEKYYSMLGANAPLIDTDSKRIIDDIILMGLEKFKSIAGDAKSDADFRRAAALLTRGKLLGLWRSKDALFSAISQAVSIMESGMADYHKRVGRRYDVSAWDADVSFVPQDPKSKQVNVQQ